MSVDQVQSTVATVKVTVRARVSVRVALGPVVRAPVVTTTVRQTAVVSLPQQRQHPVDLAEPQLCA